MTAEAATVLASVIGSIATISAALIGKSWGARGKKSGLGSLTTELNLDRTIWVGDYKDSDGPGSTKPYSGSIEFRQYGSRVVGEGTSEGRKWLIEGVVYQRKLCYVYVGVDKNPVSIGSVNLQIDNSGNNLDGQWTGWAPDGAKPQPQELHLKKLK